MGYMLKYELDARRENLSGWERYFIAQLKGTEDALVFEKIQDSTVKFHGRFASYNLAFKHTREILENHESL